MTENPWKSYEEVATYLLNIFAKDFGLGKVEGKQIVSGSSGANWEIDAKGCIIENAGFLIVECKRHKTGVSQAIVGSLAYTIKDTGASGGILVTPIDCQTGAKKVLEAENIKHCILNAESTTTEYFMRCLENIYMGDVAPVKITEHLSIKVKDNYGNVVDSLEADQ